MEDATESTEKRKMHQSSRSGRKADKKKAKSPHVQEYNTARQRNPKAFAIQSAVKAARRFRRTIDIQSKGCRMPEVDRTPLKPPPAVVAIVGPPKVGKTTLMQCLIKNFTKQNMSSIKGPVTLVSGKKKRLTLIECNNDINQMIDVAKIADLVLLLIDAKSGFEMETMEFLNICQAHGMPRIIGVLTHLDLFANKKSLQKTKTMLKKRYRTEIPRGEKMFYLSGVLHGAYLKNEVQNLGRFISVMKFLSSSWQKTHPYVVVDRMEDITPPEILAENPATNRNICVYGFARGAALKKNFTYHIPGCGDYFVKNIDFLPDPCPLPEKRKKRSLNQKERLIYAPMSGVGGVVYDKDAVYIELKGSHSHTENLEDSEKFTDKIVTSLASTSYTIDEKMAETQLSLFKDAEPLTDRDVDRLHDDVDNEDSDEESDSEDEGDDDENDRDSDGDDVKNDEEDSDDDEQDSDDENQDSDDDDQDNEADSDDDDANANEDEKKTKSTKKVRFAFDDDCDSDVSVGGIEEGSPKKKKQKKDSAALADDSSEDELGHQKWKDELVQKAANAFYERQKKTVNLQKLVYGQEVKIQPKSEEQESNDDILDGFFRVPISKTQQKDNLNKFECSKFVSETVRDWANEKELDAIKDCFVTGTWSQDEDAQNLLQNDDELFGDFEDFELNGSNVEKKDEDDKDQKPEPTEEEKVKEEKSRSEKRLEKKRKLKELFNAHFDDKESRSFHDDLKMEADEQETINRKEFEDMDDDLRVRYEGFRPGLYLRIEVEQMPCEFVQNFDPTYPIILGALLSGEDKMGYLQVRIKNHRWYPRILKCRDPLIISLGWRRFQTIMLYYTTDDNGRNRLLKYTPKHMHCLASFWGPVTPQKSGFCAVQSVNEVKLDFRIAALGSVLEVNHSTAIVKKLKLIGNPFEIFRKTAFIEGMFHSVMEVVKYEGAAIRTVSGIKGQIKKALRKPPGIFRATFEDKILMSDIVFLRTWVKVEVPQFCTSLSTLLLPPEEKRKWQGMRTLGHLKYDLGIKNQVPQDCLYTTIERKLRQFDPLVIPNNIQRNLPFQDKVIHLPKKTPDAASDRVAVIREPYEREVAKAMEMLKMMHKMKTRKENKEMRTRVKAHRKDMKKMEAIRHKKIQERKKRIFQRKQAQKKPDA